MWATFVPVGAPAPRASSQEMTGISSRLQKVQEGCSRGERPEGKQAETLGTTGGRDAGDQTGLRSDTGAEKTGSRGTGSQKNQNDGSSAEQSAVAKDLADH